MGAPILYCIIYCTLTLLPCVWSQCRITSNTYPTAHYIMHRRRNWGAGAPGACAPPCFINCYINCSLFYVWFQTVSPQSKSLSYASDMLPFILPHSTAHPIFHFLLEFLFHSCWFWGGQHSSMECDCSTLSIYYTRDSSCVDKLHGSSVYVTFCVAT